MTAATAPVLYCSQIRELFGLAEVCCDSCHEDHDQGYSDLMELEDREGKVIAYVCCGVERALPKDWLATWEAK